MYVKLVEFVLFRITFYKKPNVIIIAKTKINKALLQFIINIFIKLLFSFKSNIS